MLANGLQAWLGLTSPGQPPPMMRRPVKRVMQATMSSRPDVSRPVIVCGRAA
jgi:hypothetical protein